MGKYSSDSDSEKRRNKRSHKSSSRRRSSSCESSSSKIRHKKNIKTVRKRRDRSRDNYAKLRRSHSRSESYHHSHKVRSYKRSCSRDKLKTKRSPSKDRYSKDRYRSRRSRSRSYIKEYVSKKRYSTSPSSSCSSSSSSSFKKSQNSKPKILKDAENGKDCSIKIDLTKDCDVPIMDVQVLDDINKDNFAPQPFSSTNKKIPEMIVIDLQKQTIKMPQIELVEPDSIFHHNLFLSEEARSEKWVKELFTYRQKALQQGIKNNHHQ